MKKHFYNALFGGIFLLALIATGCSEDVGYPDVDGQAPTMTLTTEHIKSGAGHDFTIEGKLIDEDGISAVRLECKDLYLNKTIDLIEIYGEPKKSYDLKYSFALAADELGEQFTVKVTVVDVGGRETSQDVLITMDGDFEDPKFVVAPAEGSMVAMLLRDGSVAPYEMSLEMSDDRGLKSLYYNIEGSENYTKTIDINGVKSFTYSLNIDLPAVKKDYPMTLVITDTADKTDTIKCTISVTDVMDFEKMYLADVATDAELNSDVFGVPMRIDHVGEFKYEAIYYNREAGTEVFFLPQKTSFLPTCYGLDPSDDTKLTDNPADAKPFVLDQANTYYKININILEKTYDISWYSVEEAVDPWPSSMIYGKETMDKWNDGGSTMMTFTFGLTSSNPTEVVSFVQDSTNPHLFYCSDLMNLTSGEKMNFIIHNYHTDQWWNFVRWCSDSETEPEIFGYYSGSTFKNENYTGPTNGNDVWSKPTVNVSGTYRFYFDSHLGRAKLVKE